RELLGNEPTHRMTGDVGRLPADVIHQYPRVGGHGLDGDGAAAGYALTDAAIVKRDHLILRLERENLRSPCSSNATDALNEKQWRASARDLVGKSGIWSGKDRHAKPWLE